MRMARILVVEDNAELALGLRNSLEIAGYDVVTAHDGPTGLERARTIAPDLLLLDVMLPGLDGLRVLRTLREEGNDVPVLLLTARSEESDKVMGFRLGADDYVTKPFGVLELMARVEARLRRGTAEAPPSSCWQSFGDIDIHAGARLVRRRGQPVELSPKAFALLQALARKEGDVASRAELLKAVWGYSSSVLSRTVDTHIAELRRKLEDDPTNPRHIVTVWKTGYRFVA